MKVTLKPTKIQSSRVFSVRSLRNIGSQKPLKNQVIKVTTFLKITYLVFEAEMQGKKIGKKEEKNLQTLK